MEEMWERGSGGFTREGVVGEDEGGVEKRV